MKCESCMTVERAIEILNPDHREHYESIEPVNEACRMGVKALEKQMPKKLIDNGIGGYICPHCEGAILDLPHEMYHRDCGGRLE